jgi:hypothetical protein
MPRKFSLKGFLRQDILSKRPKALIPYYNDHKASRKPGLQLKREPAATDNPSPPEPATSLSDNGEDDAQPARDVDSLFGEPIYTTEEIRQQKLDELLARDQKQSHPAKQQQSENQELDKLKKELHGLVMWELEATGEQRHYVRHRKADLIDRIARLEAKIKSCKVKSCKGKITFSPTWKHQNRILENQTVLTIEIVKSNEEAKLPEPISPAEKKHLQMVQQRVAKGLVGLEVWLGQLHDVSLQLINSIGKGKAKA